MQATALDTRPGTFIPRLRLFTERFLVRREEGLFAEPVEEGLPVLSLCFDYGGVEVRAADRREGFFVSGGAGVARVERDREGEARVQCMLESFGAVEVACADDYEPDLDSKADYIVQIDGNVHGFCSFTAYAVPQLQKLGYEVEIAADYPYQVVQAEVPWFASVEAEVEKSDWFSLELGVEVDGRRVNLMPALLELVESCPDEASLESLLEMPARFRVVPVGENRYLPVPPERLKSLIRVLLELYRGERLEDGALRFHGSRAASLAKLDAALSSRARLLWGGNTAVRDRGRTLATAREPLPAPDLGLQASLRPYQEAGLAWLQQLRECGAGGVLADDMGLGKTLQTIAHLSAEKASGRADRPSLIVMPTSLVGNWQRELERFAPGLKVCVLHGKGRASRRREVADSDVVLTTYPLLVRDLEVFKAEPYHLLVLDEAQAVKNPRSLASRGARELVARHRLCLSGTPLENNLEELWSLFDFLMPGFLGDAERFRSHFRVPIEREGSALRLELLREAVSPFMLRRMKEHVARDLPPKTELVRPVELGDEQRELYESIRVSAHGDVRKAIRDKGIARSTIAILDALMKLRQACCDPRLVSMPSARKVQSSAKYDLFFELLSKQLEQGRRVLVFSQFTRMLSLLAQGLEQRGLRYVELTGATLDRQRTVDRFERREVDVFLISLKAGGTGLNLTSADTVIHYDPWWNRAAQNQATDRAYRIGQTRPVFAYSLIVAGSVEERMLRLQQRKSGLLSSLFGAGGGESPELMSAVDDLFAPLE